MLKKIILITFNIVLLTGLVFSVININYSSNVILYRLLFILIGGILYLVSLFTRNMKTKVVSRLFYVSFIIYSFIVIAYSVLLKTNILTVFSSVNSLKEYILSTREKGVITYILIQTAQVVILPIPAAVICVVGSLIYGPLLGGIYCSIGVLIGSFISFGIGRTCGHRLVSWIVGENNCKKYSAIILKRGSFFLSIAFLLPMFPDDILCLIAGITSMSLLSFSWVTILIRPIGVICMSYFGSGQLIPFTGWGIYVWLVILVIAVALVFVIYKYQDPMQEYILKKVFRKEQSKKSINRRIS